MAAAQVFKVLTEFRFEVGQAVLGARSLQSEVKKISDLADNTMLSLQRLGMGFLAQMGLIRGGTVSFLSLATGASEKFLAAQTALMMVMSSIGDKLTPEIQNFEIRANAAKKIIEDLVGVAREFAIPEESLFGMTKLLIPVLGQMGALGANFENAIDLSRNVLKAAPLLGLVPGLIEGQLVDIVAGASSGQGRLWDRLVGDTPQFSQFAKRGGVADFNMLPAAKRVQLLRDALFRFTKDTEALEARVNSLNGQITIFKSLIHGFDSILRPLGDSIKQPLIRALQLTNQFLKTQGKQLIINLTNFITPLIEKPRKFVITLMQLSRLIDDLSRTRGMLLFGSIMTGLSFAIGKLTKTAAFLNPIVGQVSVMLGVLANVLGQVLSGPIAAIVVTTLKWLAILTPLVGILAAVLAYFGVLGSALTFLLSSVLLPIIAAMGLFQLVSRAVAYARIADLQVLPAFIERFMGVITKLKTSFVLLLDPFITAFDTFAELISPLFRIHIGGSLVLSVFEGIADLLKLLAESFVNLQAVLSGFMEMISEMVLILMDLPNSIDDLMSGRASMQVFEAFGREFSRFREEAFTGMMRKQEDMAIVQQKVEVGKVEIRNEFREKQEPDRIAFTIKDQLAKAAMNPTQGRGRTSSRGLVTSFAATQ